MDRFLRSLLTSSAGDSVDTDRSLSEIAKSVLADQAGKDPRNFREKAGLLALLNLLGIVEAFYGGMPLPVGGNAGTPPARDPAVASLIHAPPTAVAPPAPVADPVVPGPISIVSGLTKLLGAVQPPATGDGSPAQASPSMSSILAGIDPSLIAGMLSMIASMAKARPTRAPAKVEAQSSDDAPSESGESTAEPEPSPEAAPPSPLQMLLGIDPKVLTLALNVLAELMKSKQAEAKEKPAEGQAPAEVTAAKQAPREPSSPQAASGRKAHRMHRPGFGIYRSPLVTPRLETKGQTQKS